MSQNIELRWVVPKRTICVDGIEVLPILQQRTLNLPFGQWSEWSNVPVVTISDGKYVQLLKSFVRNFPKELGI